MIRIKQRLIIHVSDQPGIAAKLFNPLADKGILVDMIVQNMEHRGIYRHDFHGSQMDFKKAIKITQGVANELGAKAVTSDDKIAKVSLVGVGLTQTHSGIASRMFSVLAREGINIMMISTSEIKISCVIDEKFTELAVRAYMMSLNLGG